MPVEAKLLPSFLQARRNEIVPTQELVSLHISWWVWSAYVRSGRRELASGSDPEELRKLFNTNAEFQAHCDGRDFTNGLAGVCDEEFNSTCMETVFAVAEFLRDGQVGIGRQAVVNTFPLGKAPYREIPLFRREWIDVRILELVVWWQELFRLGFRLLPALDPHPAAFERVFPREMECSDADRNAPLAEVEEEEINAIQNKSARLVARLGGKRRIMGGMEHVCIDACDDLPDLDLRRRFAPASETRLPLNGRSRQHRQRTVDSGGSARPTFHVSRCSSLLRFSRLVYRRSRRIVALSFSK